MHAAHTFAGEQALHVEPVLLHEDNYYYGWYGWRKVSTRPLNCGQLWRNSDHLLHTTLLDVRTTLLMAIELWQHAAMKGNVQSRHMLGAVEAEKGNNHSAMKQHFSISIKMGYKLNLVPKHCLSYLHRQPKLTFTRQQLKNTQLN